LKPICSIQIFSDINGVKIGLDAYFHCLEKLNFNFFENPLFRAVALPDFFTSMPMAIAQHEFFSCYCLYMQQSFMHLCDFKRLWYY